MNDIFSESIKYFFQNYSGQLSVLFILVFLYGLWYCFSKAGTANFLRNRIWLFYAGKYELKNKNIAKAWDEINDIENFRFKTGFKFSTPEEFHFFVQWLRKFKIPIYEAAKFSKYFNVVAKYFVAEDFDKKSRKLFIYTLLTAFLLMAVSWLYGEIKDNAYLVVKETKYQFSFDGKSADAYGKRWDESACLNFNKDSMDYDKAKNIKIICTLFSSKGREVYTETINSQRNFLIFLTIFLTIFIFVFMRKAYYYSEANKFFMKYIDVK